MATISFTASADPTDRRPRLHHARRTRPTETRQGFTLIEVVLVAVVLVILGTMIAPRMAGTVRGRFNAAAEGVATSMATFAFHEATDDRPVALSYHAESRRLDVLVLGAEEGGGAEWRPMPMAPAVILPDDFEFVRVSVDQALLDPRDWFVATPPSGRRPDVRLRLESETGDGAEIVLTPHALAPAIVRDGDPEAPYIRESANLDAMGAGRESW